MKSILITGGAGFIGSNFVKYFLKKYTNYKIINLDKLTYAGNLNNLSEVKNSENYHFIQGDICDKNLVENIFQQFDIQGVIHFAAESHVDNSISNPDDFVKTNVFGTYNLLEAAKNHWLSNSYEIKKGYEQCRFHHISTDEVYGSISVGAFTEESPFAPNSPYSATKASSDMMVRAYHKTYGLNCVTTNSSNNYGENQHPEKLIPVIIQKAISGEKIPIYGNGKNVRDWIYVLDHCRAIDQVFHKGKSGETYNIGAENEWDNLSVAELICEILDEKIPLANQKSYKEQIHFVKDRAGHDQRYAVDCKKIKREIGWEAEQNFREGISKTINHYINIFKK